MLEHECFTGGLAQENSLKLHPLSRPKHNNKEIQMDVDSSVVYTTQSTPVLTSWDDADSCLCCAHNSNGTTNATITTATDDTDTPLSFSSISISTSTGDTNATTSREEDDDDDEVVLSSLPSPASSDDGECHCRGLIDSIAREIITVSEGDGRQPLQQQQQQQQQKKHQQQQQEQSEFLLPSIGELPSSLEIIEAYNLYGNVEKFMFLLQSYRRHKEAIELLISQNNNNNSGSDGGGGGGGSAGENRSLLKYINIELNYLEEFYCSFPFQAKNSNNNNNNNHNNSTNEIVIIPASTITTQTQLPSSLSSAFMDLSQLTSVSSTACVSTTTSSFTATTTTESSTTNAVPAVTDTTTSTGLVVEPKSEPSLPTEPSTATSVTPPAPTTTVELGVSVADLDRSDREDPQCVVDYVGDIFHYFVEKEVSQSLKPSFLSVQTEINEKMRAILIDWMVDVQYSLKLLPETLFLSVNIMDHFLSRTSIRRTQLQLVGISCMVIASKYEEIFPPECNDFIYISDNATTHDQILLMERTILSSLRFSVTFVSPLDFLRRYSRLANSNYAVHSLSKYLIETMLLDVNATYYLPSMIAAGSVYLARAMVGVHPHWTPGLEQMTGFTQPSVRKCAIYMNAFVKLVATSTLKTIKKKYATAKYGKVANIELLTFKD